MPIWKIEAVEQRPSVTLRGCAVYEVPLNGENQPWTRHLAGYALEERQGQVSSPVLKVDAAAGRCVTRSGRVYQLYGQPGLGSDAQYVWNCWKGIAGVLLERDVTAEMCGALAAAKATSRSE